jgi:mono/diheme cytochrome c family protein
LTAVRSSAERVVSGLRWGEASIDHVAKEGAMRLRRQKATLAAALTLLFAAASAGSAPAGEKLDGRALFRQNCKVCHEKGSPHGEFTALTLIQDQWKEFYSEKLIPTHKDLMLPGQNTKFLESLTPEQLKAIEKFCVDHAADSEQPQSCT